MGKNSAIEWTDHTFNPWWGCVKVSPGCEHCYAETLANRWGHNIWGPAKTTRRRTFGDKHWNEPVNWNKQAAAEGVRRRVFCGSMCDVFEDHPDIADARHRLWGLIVNTPMLDWLLLTKRPENITKMLPVYFARGYQQNVWLGTSIENQKAAEDRIMHLLRVPAAIRFISAEPLLGSVNLTAIKPTGYTRRMIDALNGVTVIENSQQGAAFQDMPKIDWVIVGGESGPKHRPMQLEWAKSLVEQCKQASVSVFVKQLGGHPDKHHDISQFPRELQIREFPHV